MRWKTYVQEGDDDLSDILCRAKSGLFRDCRDIDTLVKVKINLFIHYSPIKLLYIISTSSQRPCLYYFNVIIILIPSTVSP